MTRLAFFVLVWLMASVTTSSAMTWSWERHPRQHHHHHHHRHTETVGVGNPTITHTVILPRPETVDCTRVRAAVTQLQSSGATDWCAADIGVARCSSMLNKQLEESDHKQIAIISGCMRERQ